MLDDALAATLLADEAQHLPKDFPEVNRQIDLRLGVCSSLLQNAQSLRQHEVDELEHQENDRKSPAQGREKVEQRFHIGCIDRTAAELLAKAVTHARGELPIRFLLS